MAALPVPSAMAAVGRKDESDVGPASFGYRAMRPACLSPLRQRRYNGSNNSLMKKNGMRHYPNWPALGQSMTRHLRLNGSNNSPQAR